MTGEAMEVGRHLRRHAEHHVEDFRRYAGIRHRAGKRDRGTRRFFGRNLMMQEQPAASELDALRAGRLIGKFHGVKAATGPTGSRSSIWRWPGLRAGIVAATAAPAFIGIPFEMIGRGCDFGTRFW